MIRAKQRVVYEVESVAMYLARGGKITKCPPRSVNVPEWDVLGASIDSAAAPFVPNVETSSWSVGSTIANSIQESACGVVADEE